MKNKTITCPNCGGHSIQVIDNAPAGTKTSLDLNPLRPFTLTKTKRKDKRVSGKKVGAAFLTGGVSLLVTGVHSKVGIQVLCTQCGYVWEAK